MLRLILFFVLFDIAYGDHQCTALSGTCQQDYLACAGWYVSGLCSGSATRKCCRPPGDDSQCTAVSGTCQQDDTPCSGGAYQTGLCSGPASRKCCVPSGGGSCSSITIVPRSDWGARPPASTSPIGSAVSKFFIHHTAGSTCNSITTCSTNLQSVQNYHMDHNGWADIGYSFLIGNDGRVYEGRGWGRVGAHTSGQNSVSYAASFMGNYMTSLPSESALQAAQDLIACGISLGYITSSYSLYGHRDAGSTSCPGDALYAQIQSWPRYNATPL